MQNQHFLITGGSSGIGLKIAECLHQRGAVVHLTGRRREKLQQAADLLAERVFIYPGDIADPGDRASLIDALKSNCQDRLDGLVMNAARYGFRSILEIDQADFEHYFQVNTLSVPPLIQACHPLLKNGQGKAILSISSTLAEKPVAGVAAYAAAKAALNSLTKSCALEFAADGIRANIIQPGVVDTPIHEPQSSAEPSREDKMAQLAPLHPLGKVGEPIDVAAAAVFLLSDESKWITGATLNVDGGILLG